SGPLDLSGWHLHGWRAPRPAAPLQSPQHVLAVERGRCSMIILRRTRPITPALARSIAVVVSSASMIACPPRGTAPVPISCQHSCSVATEQARTTTRLVWIQFTGPWCPNCLRMERDSFPHADVIDHSQRSFVPLKLRPDVHERLALGFNLSGLPAT